MNSDLTREIVKRMLLCAGIAPPPLWGHGLSAVDLKTQKIIQVTYDDGDTSSHQIWFGKAKIGTNVMRGMTVDLTVDEIYEYALILQVNDLPVYGIRLIFGESDNGQFLIQSSKGWTPASAVLQASALQGMETIVSFGLTWEPCLDLVSDNIDVFYENLSSLVEMVDIQNRS